MRPTYPALGNAATRRYRAVTLLQIQDKVSEYGD